MWSHEIEANQDYFSWDKVNVSLRENDKSLVYSGSGRVLSGRVMAIMGPSGSGKTTLLNAISGTQTPECSVSRAVYYNGMALKTDAELLSLISYKTQNSLNFQYLTIYETLRLSFINKSEMTESEIEEKIAKLIYGFNLAGSENKCMHEISGGMVERVNIISTLLSDSPILIFDEALSKLDSFVLKEAMGLIYQAAKNNKIIIMSLHQPSKEIEGMIDDLILISQGRLVYHGEFSKVRKYFKDLGHLLSKRDYAKEMIDIITNDVDSNEVNVRENAIRIRELQNKFSPDYVFFLIEDKKKLFIENTSLRLPLLSLINYMFLDFYRGAGLNILNLLSGFLLLIVGFLSNVHIVSSLIYIWGSDQSNVFFKVFRYIYAFRMESILIYIRECVYKQQIFVTFPEDARQTSYCQNMWELSSKFLTFDFEKGPGLPLLLLIISSGFFYNLFLRLFKYLAFKVLFKNSINTFKMVMYLFKSGKVGLVNLLLTTYLIILSVNLLTMPFLEFFNVGYFLLNQKTNILWGLASNYLMTILISIYYIPTYLDEPLKKTLFPTSSAKTSSGFLINVLKYVCIYALKVFRFKMDAVFQLSSPAESKAMQQSIFFLIPHQFGLGGWNLLFEPVFVYSPRSFSIAFTFESLEIICSMSVVVSQLYLLGYFGNKF